MNPETKLILDVTGVQRELKTIIRRLQAQNREATTEEKAEIIELQQKLRKMRRGEFM